MNLRSLILFTFFVQVIFIGLLNAQVETKLIASDGEADDYFGRRAAISGEFIIVGASNDDNERGVDAGSAYVFRRNGTDWIETQKIVPDDIADSNVFGYDVDIDYDYSIITACWSDEYGEKSGSAYIYKLEGTRWKEEAKLVANDAEEDNRFGISAAISGDYAVVGAFFDNDNGYRSGSAYIFKRNNTTWEQQIKLLPSDGAESNWFGVNVEIDGDYAMISSRYNDNEKGVDAGAVYVFKRDGENWLETTKLMPKDSLDSVLFEIAAIEGDNLIVGAWRDDTEKEGAGSFHHFTRSNENWTNNGQYFASDSDVNDYFGCATALQGDYAVIGAYLDDDNGRNSGSAYVFKWNGSNWNEEMKLTAGDGDSLDYYGLTVGIDQDYIIVAARSADGYAEKTGAVYVYYNGTESLAYGIEQDSLALLALYESTSGNDWTDKTNWLGDSSISTWKGITVRNGRVTGIQLAYNNVAGVLPNEIQYLTYLTSFAILGNEVAGEIPQGFGNLTNLKGLNLSYNNMTGWIPNELGYLSELGYLAIVGNQIEGPIPSEIYNLTNLAILAFSRNQIIGEISSDIGKLEKLKELYLLENNISGAIPNEILNLTNLELINISSNSFTDIPDLTTITTLSELYIQDNKLTFEDIERNMSIANFTYSPQDSVGESIDTVIAIGETLTIECNVGGSENIYQWFKNGNEINGAVQNSITFISADSSDSGVYECRITSSKITDLTLHSRKIKVQVGVVVEVSENKDKLPDEFSLSQNYPNPFNPTTAINYSIPAKSKGEMTKARNVTLIIYDMLGREVAVLVNEKQNPGYYEVVWNASDFSSGVYFYHLNAGEFNQSRKLLLIK